MKIILEDGLSLKNKTGIGNYTLMLKKVLEELGYNVIFKRKNFLENIKNSTLKRFLYILWLNTFFLIELSLTKKPAILITPNYLLPFFRVKNVKYISVIHDLCSYIYPQSMNKIQVFYSRLAIKNTIRLADKIVTISNTVKNEIISQFNLPENKLSLVYCSLEFSNFENINMDNNFFSKLNIIPKKYLLSVSTINKRKNVQGLLEAFNLIKNNYPDIKLVLVGNKGNDFLHSDNENIIYIGYIDDNELYQLYKKALVYVFPSLYEGFGIPILEAQVTETPVIASDIPVFREVSGCDSILFCDTSSEEIYKAIEKLLIDYELREKLVKNGLNNINRFKIDVIKEQLTNVLTR